MTGRRAIGKRGTIRAVMGEVIRYHPERIQMWRVVATQIAEANVLMPLVESDRLAVVRLVVAAEPLVDPAMLRGRAEMVHDRPDKVRLFGIEPRDVDGVAAALVAIADVVERDLWEDPPADGGQSR